MYHANPINRTTKPYVSLLCHVTGDQPCHSPVIHWVRWARECPAVQLSNQGPSPLGDIHPQQGPVVLDILDSGEPSDKRTIQEGRTDGTVSRTDTGQWGGCCVGLQRRWSVLSHKSSASNWTSCALHHDQAKRERKKEGGTGSVVRGQKEGRFGAGSVLQLNTVAKFDMLFNYIPLLPGPTYCSATTAYCVDPQQPSSSLNHIGHNSYLLFTFFIECSPKPGHLPPKKAILGAKLEFIYWVE